MSRARKPLGYPPAESEKSPPNWVVLCWVRGLLVTERGGGEGCWVPGVLGLRFGSGGMAGGLGIFIISQIRREGVTEGW